MIVVWRRRSSQRLRHLAAAVVAGMCVTLAHGMVQASPRVLTPLSVSSRPFINQAPLFIAIEEGYFAQQGIEVRLTTLRETAQNWPALITGQLDVYVGSITAGFMGAILQGAKLRIVADAGHTGPGDRSIAFMVRQDLIDSGRFRTLKDLRGMRIALSARGNIPEMMILQILRNRAVLTEQDVHFQQIPTLLLSDLFRAKAIDASAALEPLVTRIETLGLAKTVVTLNDVLPRSQYAMVVYGPNLLARNPGLGQRFMNGYLRGVRQYQAGKTDRNVAILQKFTREDEALLRKMPWPLLHLDGHVNVESIQQVQAWWIREGLLERAVSPEQFLDTGFARRAFRMLTATP